MIETRAVNFLDIDVISRKLVNVSDRLDYLKPWITGMAFLNNKELMIADRTNKRLTLFDPDINGRKASIMCNSSPFDIAVIDDNHVVVSYSNEHALQFVQVAPTLTFSTRI